MLDLRLRSSWLETRPRHCVVSLEQDTSFSRHDLKNVDWSEKHQLKQIDIPIMNFRMWHISSVSALLAYID